MRLHAHWIWKKQSEYNPYNQTVLARKVFALPPIKTATISITADTEYRLYINGQWVNDGPARGWPEHYYVDRIDVAPYLEVGINDVRIVARYFGVGTQRQVPVQAGILAQIDVRPARGRIFSMGTDASWSVAELKAWSSDTPIMSLQHGPFEHYDARLERGLTFSPAAELFAAHQGPHKDLRPRDVALLTREPRAFQSLNGARLVNRDWLSFTFPVARLLHPGLIEANTWTSVACALATVVVAKAPMRLRVETTGLDVRVNGKKANGGAFRLHAGKNLLFAVATDCFEHDMKDFMVRFVDIRGFVLVNPIDGFRDGPWCLIPADESGFAAPDIPFFFHTEPHRDAVRDQFLETRDKWLEEVVDQASFERVVGSRARLLASETVALEDAHAQFAARAVLGDASRVVEKPEALIHNNVEYTSVAPSSEGDVELSYDLGEESCGYLEFDLFADEGTVVDVFGVEYISPSGAVQHTGKCRNGFRYICRQGGNRFLSLKRRAARYVFVTLRNQKGPVQIRRIQMVESTYPVSRVGKFSCSDPFLERVWNVSARTLQLCMEDTFTDCPLYEQALWVGDARNDALFAYTVFGATDIARRSIVLAGQSLDRYPLVGAQVPGGWEMLLPAWSFLWGIGVWEHYFYTGDKTFLADTWGWVKRNLEGAAKFCDERGLVSTPFWNMFDWSPKDDRYNDILRQFPEWMHHFRVGNDVYHRTVIHNSMLLAGAIGAAVKCADALGKRADAKRLKAWRKSLVTALNRLWDDKKQGYPDSIHNDGTVSRIVSQHSAFLSLLYDIVPAKHRAAAIADTVKPRAGVTRIGSPFGVMFQYQAMEKVGLADEIVPSIRRNYLPMIEAGATTVWEAFPSGALGYGEFPTRSHCHAWSSAPVYFLNRIVLGIRQIQPGCRRFEISPRLSGLQWAKGATATPHGPVKVEWERREDHVQISASAPENVKLRFKSNDSLGGMRVRFSATYCK